MHFTVSELHPKCRLAGQHRHGSAPGPTTPRPRCDCLPQRWAEALALSTPSRPSISIITPHTSIASAIFRHRSHSSAILALANHPPGRWPLPAHQCHRILQCLSSRCQRIVIVGRPAFGLPALCVVRVCFHYKPIQRRRFFWCICLVSRRRCLPSTRRARSL